MDNYRLTLVLFTLLLYVPSITNTHTNYDIRAATSVQADSFIVNTKTRRDSLFHRVEQAADKAAIEAWEETKHLYPYETYIDYSIIAPLCGLLSMPKSGNANNTR